MKLRKTILCCLLILFSPLIYAITVSGLYQATVPVQDESKASRDSALKVALIQVLVKLTGDRNANKSEGIRAFVRKPEQFVQQFRYQQITDKENQSVQSQKLWVQFDENALNELIRSYGLSLWGKERPSILVWLAYEGNGPRRIVSLEESAEYLSMLDKHAAIRGLPLLFPLLDLEDTSNIRVSDIWGGFKEPVLKGSERYQADVILTGKLKQLLPDLWKTKWVVYSETESFAWEHQGGSAEIVLREGIDSLGDRLAIRYANTILNRTEVIELVVLGVSNLDNYAKASTYLQSLQSVSQVKVKRVMADKVLFKLISHADISAVQQAIKLGKTLEFVSHNEQLNYRLLP